MGTTIATGINVYSSSQRLWDVLTDFAAYPQWNPFITLITGNVVQGSRLTVRLQPPGGRGITMRPTVLSVVPQREFKWLGHLLVPGIFDGEHRFSIQELDDGSVRFHQDEAFKGVVVPFAAGLLKNTKRGFEQMNQALKARAESS